MAESTSRASVVSELPTARSRPLDPPDGLAALREERPISRFRFPDGHPGWLVTSHDLARSVLGDRRFSRRRELMRSPIPMAFARDDRRPAEPGAFIGMDPPDHTRYRRHLTGQFTVHRMKGLEPRIAQITEQHLDAMERTGPPADLVPSFALPIPSLVICELLGVPYGERERFQHDTRLLLSLDAAPEEAMGAFVSLQSFLRDLVVRKRRRLADDLLSGLITDGDLTDEEITNIALLLLVAGHETTANMLGIGTYTLLQHPDQLAAIRTDPTLIDAAVEELLRYLTIVHFGPTRAALEDVEIGGELVEAGEVVAISLPAANRDPERFDHPDTFEVTRPVTGHGHLTFGHGIHQCLGQQLARIEMRIGYAALFQRFPTLRLAVPTEEVRMRTDMAIYGVHSLPVAW
ncbi:MAG: cytochrome P450 [Actinopolymorphaceae bacterium]